MLITWPKKIDKANPEISTLAQKKTNFQITKRFQKTKLQKNHCYTKKKKLI